MHLVLQEDLCDSGRQGHIGCGSRFSDGVVFETQCAPLHPEAACYADDHTLQCMQSVAGGDGQHAMQCSTCKSQVVAAQLPTVSAPAAESLHACNGLNVYQVAPDLFCQILLHSAESEHASGRIHADRSIQPGVKS